MIFKNDYTVMFNLEDVFVVVDDDDDAVVCFPALPNRQRHKNEVKSDNESLCRVSMYSMTLENKVILRFQSWLIIVILVVWVDVLFFLGCNLEDEDEDDGLNREENSVNLHTF